MPKKILPYLAGFVLLLGIIMLGLRGSDSGSMGYTLLRVWHGLAAVALIGLFEAALARAKRAGELSPSGKQFGMVGRIAMTLALLLALALLGALLFSWFSGDAFSLTVYIHAVLGLVGVALSIYTFRPGIAQRV